MTITDAALPAPPDASWFKNWVDFGSLIKTASGLLLALVVGGYAAYEHFAKASQIEALETKLKELHENAVCAVTMENVIAGKVIYVSRQMRETLRGMQAATDFSALKEELEKSVPKVDKALEDMEMAREARTQNTLMFSGSERCKR